MFFEETNPSDVPFDLVLLNLQEYFPNIDIKQVKFLYHGTYNVFEVTYEDSCYIFRFPDRSLRNEIGGKLITQEVETLTFLKEFLSVSIPNPEFIVTNPDFPFMGYQKIPGLSLSRVFSTLKHEQLQIIGQQIGSFLSDLHDISLSRYYSSFSTAFDWNNSNSPFSVSQYIQKHRLRYKNLRNRIFPLLNQSQQEWCIRQFKAFFVLETEFEFYPTLCHCDFDISNILVDPHSFDVTGIIDFEDTHLYDPAVDFLFFNEGEVFLKSIFSTYTNEIDQKFQDRMIFLFNTSFLPYIVYGLNHDRPELIQAGLERLEMLMNL